MLINASSLGINKSDKIELNYEGIGNNKFYYDVIYNPTETNFLKEAKKYGNKIENGKKMFIYQAHQAFAIWHNVLPKIDEKVMGIEEKPLNISQYQGLNFVCLTIYFSFFGEYGQLGHPRG